MDREEAITAVYAPVAIFIYNRPEHTKKTLEALKKCREFEKTPIFVFCDGAKSENQAGVVEARSIAKSILGKRATYIESPVNKGLANSIIQGVTQLCNDFGRVIVLEDDLVVEPEFLEFMNSALDKYKDTDTVMQISGYMYPVPDFGSDAMYLPFIGTWGWGTWKRAWEYFDPTSEGWEVLKHDEDMRYAFNANGAIDHYSWLKQQNEGTIDSWGTLWNWSVFKAKGAVLYPPYSLVENIGFDGSGTHGWLSAKYAYKPISVSKVPITFPEEVVIDPDKMSRVNQVQRRVGSNKFLKLLMVLKGLLFR